ncbi:MAG: hypothetical protein KW804_02615, partial [Candidatus Doudnabacteria bacterium]|nr:hypothetical protein [Candidatus Doudnabacteria bacterium]
ISTYKNNVSEPVEYKITVDGTSFTAVKGIDKGSFEGVSAGKVTAIFFNASTLYSIEKPISSDLNFDPIKTSEQIVKTFKFSK